MAKAVKKKPAASAGKTHLQLAYIWSGGGPIVFDPGLRMNGVNGPIPIPKPKHDGVSDWSAVAKIKTHVPGVVIEVGVRMHTRKSKSKSS
jgi:hypothetical protein